MRSRTSSISSRVAPCFRAICTWAPNGLVGLTWSWLTTSTAMMISALVFWSRCGRPHASPATRTQKSPNFGFILYNLSWISLSSRTAFFGAIEPSFRLCVGLTNTFAKHEVEDVVLKLVERSEAVDHLSRPRSPLASDRHPTVVEERVNIALGEGGELLNKFGEFSCHGGIGLRGEERFHRQALRAVRCPGARRGGIGISTREVCPPPLGRTARSCTGENHQARPGPLSSPGRGTSRRPRPRLGRRPLFRRSGSESFPGR